MTNEFHCKLKVGTTFSVWLNDEQIAQDEREAHGTAKNGTNEVVYQVRGTARSSYKILVSAPAEAARIFTGTIGTGGTSEIVQTFEVAS